MSKLHHNNASNMRKSHASHPSNHVFSKTHLVLCFVNKLILLESWSALRSDQNAWRSVTMISHAQSNRLQHWKLSPIAQARERRWTLGGFGCDDRIEKPGFNNGGFQNAIWKKNTKRKWKNKKKTYELLDELFYHLFPCTWLVSSHEK